jgi:hypothetical protein
LVFDVNLLDVDIVVDDIELVARSLVLTRVVLASGD